MSARPGKASVTRFLNVDLDIESTANLQLLLDALGDRVIILYAGRVGRTYRARLELSRTPRSADAAIRGFCALIASLSKSGQRAWNGARTRDFNIGVQAGSEPHASEFILTAEALGSVHDLGARIVFTVYAPA